MNTFEEELREQQNRCESQELVNDEHFEKEENVSFNGDSSILFKII
jgi:hypothetical protein